MLTRCSFPLNTAFQQNKRMIYSFSYRRSLFPNQIFRRLILINGAFNVIFPFKYSLQCGSPPESSKRKTLVFLFLSFLAPLFPLRTLLLFTFSHCYASLCKPTHQWMNKRLPKRKEIAFFWQKAGEILRSVCYQILRSSWVKKGNDSKPVKRYQNVFRGCETQNQVKAI